MIALVAVGLVVVWVLLWGALSVANVVSGVLVVGFLLVGFPTGLPDFRRLVLRPVAVLRFAGYFVVKLLESNLVLAREVVSRTSRINTGVIEVRLPGCSDGLIGFVANVMALTPGTMTVDARTEPPTLFVHVLQLHDVDETRREILHLRSLAVRAFGSASAIASIDAEGES